MFRDFMMTDALPDGQEVTDPLSRWRFDAQLGVGVWRKLRYPYPKPYAIARRNFARFVRDRIIESREWVGKHLDTEAQVARRFSGHRIVVDWNRLKTTFTPEFVPVWVSDATLLSVKDWLSESTEPSIIWCGDQVFAERVAAELGLQFYSQKGKSSDGGSLHSAPKDRSLVSSWCANYKGFNLQSWSRHLIVTPPQSAKFLEQIFGRSHRRGQTQHVYVDLLITSGGTERSFNAAIDEAGRSREVLALNQKLLRATVARGSVIKTESNIYRWGE